MRRAVAPHPWYVVAVAALTAAALVIRASQLDQSLFGDELYAFYEIDGRSFASMLETVYEGPEVTPPLFFALAWLSAQLGDPTVLIRLPSLAGGVLLVPLTFVLGVRTVGSRAALVGATIVTLAPLAIFYAVEARPYGLLAAATVASTIALLRALESDRWAWWAAYGLASLAAMYTHLTAVFVLTAQLAWAAYAHRDRIARLLIVNGAAALLFLPWAPRLLRDDLPTLVSTYGPFSARPEDLLRVVGHILPGSPFVTLGRLPGVAATVAFCAVVAAAVLAGARRRTASETHLGLLVLSGAAVPAGLITYGVLSDDALFTPRTSITMLPYAALVIGALVARLPERAAAVVWLGLAVALGVGTIGALGDAGERPPYREAAAYVAERARPGDVVLERELFAGTGPWTRHFADLSRPRARVPPAGGRRGVGGPASRRPDLLRAARSGRRSGGASPARTRRRSRPGGARGAPGHPPGGRHHLRASGARSGGGRDRRGRRGAQRRHEHCDGRREPGRRARSSRTPRVTRPRRRAAAPAPPPPPRRDRAGNASCRPRAGTGPPGRSSASTLIASASTRSALDATSYSAPNPTRSTSSGASANTTQRGRRDERRRRPSARSSTGRGRPALRRRAAPPQAGT